MVPVTPAFTRFLAGRSAAMLQIASGISTPLEFAGARLEHLATRRAAGLFDFSFMGCMEVTGAGSRACLEALQSRSLKAIAPGRMVYTFLLRDDASVLIDATVWQVASDHYWIFVGRRSDVAHISAAADGYDVVLADRSRQLAVMALQGPACRPILERVFGTEVVTALPYFGFTRRRFAGADCWVARIGYAGETGYELVIADAAAPGLWESLLAAGENYGLRECGFDAIDTLRIEAGHLLFSRELASPVSPAELGMLRFVDFYRPDFRGAQALRVLRWRDPQRRLTGLLPESHPRLAQPAAPNVSEGTAVITSSCWSPLFECSLALGFVPADNAAPGSIVTLANGARARVARLPFYDPARRLPRRP